MREDFGKFLVGLNANCNNVAHNANCNNVKYHEFVSNLILTTETPGYPVMEVKIQYKIWTSKLHVLKQ